MNHAVVQMENRSPSAEQLTEAFRAVPGLTPVDAAKVSRQAYGILLRNLRPEDAGVVERSLRGQGVGTVALAEAQLPVLPEPKFTRRVELAADALVIHDAIGRPVPIAWAQVQLVAAGIVPRMNLVSFTTEEVAVSVSLTGARRQEVVTQLNHKLDTSGQLVMDIILADGRMRFQIESKEFLYKYAVDLPDATPNERFAELVRRLVARAPHALLNRGAAQLRDGTPLPQVYASKAAFADESIWLLWRAAAPAPPVQP